MSDKELSDICLRKQSPPIPPDISKGLGRNRAREDIVNLATKISSEGVNLDKQAFNAS